MQLLSEVQQEHLESIPNFLARGFAAENQGTPLEQSVTFPAFDFLSHRIAATFLCPSGESLIHFLHCKNHCK